MLSKRRFFALSLVLLLSLSAPLSQVFAQEGSEQQDPAAPAAQEATQDQSETQRLESLVETLKDSAARQELIGQIEALIEAKEQAEGAPQESAADPSAEEAGNRLLARVSNRVDAVAKQLAEAAGVVLKLPEVATQAWEAARDAEIRQSWMEIAGKVLGVLLAAGVVQWLVMKALTRPRQGLESRAHDGVLVRLLLLFLRALLMLLPLAAFAAVAYGALPLIEPRRITRLVTLALVNAHILASVATIAGDFVMAPRAPGLRLPRIGDETAYYLRIWLRRLVVVGVYGYFALEAALLLGLAPGAQAVALKILGAVLMAMAAVLILQNRQGVAQVLRGRKEGTLSALRARLADFWHLLAGAYIIAFYLVWALEVPGGFEFLAQATALTVVVFAVARLVYVAVVRVFDRGFRLTKDLQDRFPMLEARANRYLPAMRRAVQIVILAFTVLALMEVWGLGAFGWLASDFGRALGGRILTIVLIVVLALVFWEIVSAFIERFLRQRSSSDGTSSARLLTLLPLIRNVVRLALAVLVTLIVLSELGIDIGPLLAGAGVVGLAIGFGAQTLVKDVITGVFILVEDAMSVGDWVDVGGVSGGVESMTIRSVKLRDLNGVVHVIPFGEIAKVTNMNREFGYALMDIGVAYREDVDEVSEVLKTIGEEIKEDETFGPLIEGDLEVFGLQNLGDSAVEIRVRLKTKPLRQWGVRREFLRRTKKRFDELGIEIPFPHQTLYFGEDKKGGAPPAHVRVEQAAQKGGKGQGGKKRSGGSSEKTQRDEPKEEEEPLEQDPDENPKPGDLM